MPLEMKWRQSHDTPRRAAARHHSQSVVKDDGPMTLDDVLRAVHLLQAQYVPGDALISYSGNQLTANWVTEISE